MLKTDAALSWSYDSKRSHVVIRRLGDRYCGHQHQSIRSESDESQNPLLPLQTGRDYSSGIVACDVRHGHDELFSEAPYSQAPFAP